jgi:hypothetical protein
MALMLILGLSLIAASGVLVMRSFAQTKRRRTLDQIGAYGFGTDAPGASEHADMRSVFGGFATKAGERALARFDGLRAAESGLRKLLTSAGMYQTSVASFVGARILATLVGPSFLFLFVVTGALDLRLFFTCLLLTGMG